MMKLVMASALNGHAHLSSTRLATLSISGVGAG